LSDNNEHLTTSFRSFCKFQKYDGGFAILFKIKPGEEAASTRVVWHNMPHLAFAIDLAVCAKQFFLDLIVGKENSG